QHRVGRHGRAVGQARDLLVRPEQDAEPFQHRLGGIAGRQDLLHPQRPTGQRLRHQIGEGAADIDPDPDLSTHGPAPYEASACRRYVRARGTAVRPGSGPSYSTVTQPSYPAARKMAATASWSTPASRPSGPTRVNLACTCRASAAVRSIEARPSR